MRWLRVSSQRLRALLRREAVIGDIDEELRLHLEMEAEANVARGMPPEEARRAALRAFGNFGSIKERAYEVRGGGFVESAIQDVRFGARLLAKHRAFTAVAVLTLALGIGANTAIFSVVHALLLQPLPYPAPDRIVMVWEVTPEGRHQNNTSRYNVMAWREQSHSFEALAAFSDQRISFTGGSGEPEEVAVQLANPELFRILRVKPLRGRVLTPEDAKPDAPRTVVLSYGFWQRRFGGDPGILGKTVTLNGGPRTVVGILPPGFQWYIQHQSGTTKPPEIWVALPMPTEGDGALNGRFLAVVGRLKQGVTRERAAAELKTIKARIAQDSPQYNKGFTAEVIPLREQLVGNVRPALLILLGAVACVLLIACANVANLMLSRAAVREKEIAVRTAIGARRLRVVRQLLTESLLLALLGGLLGLALAWWGIRALVAISPRDLINLQDVGLHPTVLAWTLVIALTTGILFGLVPALEATRLDLNNSLKEGGKGSAGQGTRSSRLRGAFVVAEVALALMLLTGAGLLVQSFGRLRNIEPGFRTDDVLTLVITLPERKYTEDRQVIGFFREALERVRALPGVRSAGMVNYLPLYGGLGSATDFTVTGRPALPPGQAPSTDVRVADADYFRTLGIPLVRGRNFSASESSERKDVVLISQEMARRYFPGEDPLGKIVSVDMFDEPRPTEIVGIVGDARYDSLVDQPHPTVYFPLPVLTYSSMTLVLHTLGDPEAIVPAVRRALHAVDPDQPIADVRTMNQVMADIVGRARFNTLLLGLFAALATVLAAIGIFGVMSYSVALRTREIGLRMALGAQRGIVLRLVLRQGLLLTLLGIALGVTGALALTRLLRGLLYEVSATDPVTFGAIALLLVAVSWIACYIPARRAARVNPLIAMRYE
jgi:putative ABC transport system permease protein